MLTGDQVFELFNKHGLINAGPIKDGSTARAAALFPEAAAETSLVRLHKFNAESAMNYAALNYTG
jgi:hypothetical protein